MRRLMLTSADVNISLRSVNTYPYTFEIGVRIRPSHHAIILHPVDDHQLNSELLHFSYMMLRPTAASIAQNSNIQMDCALPWGALIAPLTPSPKPRITPPDQSTLSEATRESFTESSAPVSNDLPRCKSCGGYISTKCEINPRNWRCSLCNGRNSLPSRYARAVRAGTEGLELIPELSRSIYDVAVDDEHVTPVAYIFLLDENGDRPYLDSAREAIRKALDVIEGETLVGVMFYGEKLSLIDTRGEGVIRRVSALDTDVSVPHVFTPYQWLRKTGPKVSDAIMRVLSRLKPNEEVYDPTKKLPRAMGSAIRTALDMVEASGLIASRLVAIGAGESNYGDGQIEVSGEDMASKDRFQVAAVPFYSEQGERASALGAMVDVYIVSKTPVDVASISPLAQISGGRLILYESGENALSQDVWQHLNDPAVVRGLLRVRTSPEFTVSDVFGCGVYRDGEVPDVFRLNCHGHTSTLALDFAFTDEVGFSGRRNAPSIQVAFRGVFIEPGELPQRVLRVETQTFPVSSSIVELRKEADANATTTLIFHKAIAAADEVGIREARMLLFDWLANLLARTASVTADGQPEVDPSLDEYPSIKTIPRLMFGLIRSFLFRQEAVAPDQRSALRCIWEDLSPELLAAAAYPRLFSFLNLEEKSIKELALSTAAVRESGHPVFMLDAFSEVVIYYAHPARRDLVFPPPESSTVMRVRAACIRGRPVTPKCVVCREGTPKDRWFKGYLMEDPVPGAQAQSFSAFMQGIVDAAYEIINEASK